MAKSGAARLVHVSKTCLPKTVGLKSVGARPSQYSRMHADQRFDLTRNPTRPDWASGLRPGVAPKSDYPRPRLSAATSTAPVLVADRIVSAGAAQPPRYGPTDQAILSSWTALRNPGLGVVIPVSESTLARITQTEVDRPRARPVGAEGSRRFKACHGRFKDARHSLH